MSIYDYRRSLQLSGEPFYALIMAAMRQADSDNFEKLKEAFPDTFVELQQRYHAPGGALTTIEQQYLVSLTQKKDTEEDEL